MKGTWNRVQKGCQGTVEDAGNTDQGTGTMTGNRTWNRVQERGQGTVKDAGNMD